MASTTTEFVYADTTRYSAYSFCAAESCVVRSAAQRPPALERHSLTVQTHTGVISPSPPLSAFSSVDAIMPHILRLPSAYYISAMLNCLARWC